MATKVAAMLFLWFMEENGILYVKMDIRESTDNTLIALTHNRCRKQG